MCISSSRVVRPKEYPTTPVGSYFQPTWGNRKETRVFVPPGPEIDEGEHTP